MTENGIQEFNLSQVGADTSEMEGKYLTFWTEKQLFAIPIADVVQIIQFQSITEIPEFPYYAKGIINLRGSIIPIVDMRLRFGKEEIPYDDHTCTIVTNIADQLIGLVVDGVEEVTDIEPEEISAPPAMNGDSASSYLTGVAKHEDRVILILDTRKILGEEQFTGF